MDLVSILTSCKVIDCSHKIDENASVWPGGIRFERCPFRTFEKDGYSKDLYKLPCDIGTHIDSPSHFIKGKRSITDITIQEFVSPLVVVDVESKVSKFNDYELTVDDLLDWEKKHGKKIPDNSLVCMRTGWSKRFSDESKYRNLDDKNVMHFPGFAKEAAEFLVNQRKIHGIGIDNGPSTTFETHRVILQADLYQIENMVLEGKQKFFKMTKDVPECGGIVVALPLKIDGPEAETRVVVLCPK